VKDITSIALFYPATIHLPKHTHKTCSCFPTMKAYYYFYYAVA